MQFIGSLLTLLYPWTTTRYVGWGLQTDKFKTVNYFKKPLHTLHCTDPDQVCWVASLLRLTSSSIICPVASSTGCCCFFSQVFPLFFNLLFFLPLLFYLYLIYYLPGGFIYRLQSSCNTQFSLHRLSDTKTNHL